MQPAADGLREYPYAAFAIECGVRYHANLGIPK